MRKRYVAITAALIIGMIFGSAETAAMAGQDKGELVDTSSGEEGTVSGEITDIKENGNPEEDENPEEVGGQDGNASDSSENAAMLSLQIPQKLEVIIDPWEMDGKGQVYSEQYVIQNVGDAAGTLTLAFLCRTQEDSGVIVKQVKEGLHDDENKNIYIELVFGDGNRIILSQEKSEYQVGLEPGEEVSINFTGEVNENVPEQWKDGNIAIEGIYSWNVAEEVPTDADGIEESNDFPDDDMGESGEEITVSGNDVSGNDPMEEMSGDGEEALDMEEALKGDNPDDKGEAPQGEERVEDSQDNESGGDSQGTEPEEDNQADGDNSEESREE